MTRMRNVWMLLALLGTVAGASPSWAVGEPAPGTGKVLLTDDFEDGVVDPAKWMPGGAIEDGACGARTGARAIRIAPPPGLVGEAHLSTVPLVLTPGAELRFWLKAATAVSGPCASVAAVDELKVLLWEERYDENLNKTLDWIPLAQFSSTSFPAWTFVEVTVPPTTAPKTWLAFHGLGAFEQADWWAIDDVVVQRNVWTEPFSDDFEDGIDRATWTIEGGVWGNDCGAIGAGAVQMRLQGGRHLATRSLDVSRGGAWDFSIYYPPLPSCAIWEPAPIHLQYRHPNEWWTPWTTFWVTPAQHDDGWNRFIVELPEEAKGTDVRFRWMQIYAGYADYDRWAFDEVALLPVAPPTP